MYTNYIYEINYNQAKAVIGRLRAHILLLDS